MKEMVYGNNKNPEVLYSGEYKGHKFAILSLGSHPTAYVEDKIGLMGYEDFRLEEISVHGGFNFHDTGYWSNESKKISWLGWSYDHWDDFKGYYSIDNPFYYQAKQWTTAEIYEEAKTVIDQIIVVENFDKEGQYKDIINMIKDSDIDYLSNSDKRQICKTLCQKGYRKQCDTAREILKWLKLLYSERQKEYTNWDGNKISAVTTEWLNADIECIAAEYGVEVEE